jgi:hypothetical protein
MNIKSIERVQEYAEVFTSKKDVLDVLSLVQHECKRIDSRFLEPACGTGNFLVEILNFKLDLTLRVFGKNQLDYERNSILSLSTIYGIDILADNVNECRQYLLKIFEDKYLKKYKKKCKAEYINSASYILSKNIIWGDALTYRTPNQISSPLVFTEWSFVNSTMIQQREFVLSQLFYEEENNYDLSGQENFIPMPTRISNLVHFLKLKEND